MSSPDVDFVGASSESFNPFPDSDKLAYERKAIATEVNKNFDVLGDILATFDEQIAFYSNVDSVPVDVQTKPDEFMHIIAANRLTRDNLANIKDSIQGLINLVKQ